MFFNQKKRKLKKYLELVDDEIIFEKNEMTFNIPLDNFINIIKENRNSSFPVSKTIYSYIFNTFLNMEPEQLSVLRQKCILSGDIDIINSLDHSYLPSDIAISELANVYTDLFVLRHPILSSFVTYSLCEFFDGKIDKINQVANYEQRRFFFSEMRKRQLEYIHEDFYRFVMENNLYNAIDDESTLSKINNDYYDPKKGYSENFNYFIDWKELLSYFKNNEVFIEFETDINCSCKATVGDLLKTEPSNSFELKKSVREDSGCFLIYKNKHTLDGLPVFGINIINYTNDEINKEELIEFLKSFSNK